MTISPYTITLSGWAIANLCDAISNHIIYDRYYNHACDDELRKFRDALSEAGVRNLSLEITLSEPTRKEQK